MRVANVGEATVGASALGPLTGPAPEGLCVTNNGTVTICADGIGVRLQLGLEDAFAIVAVLNEFVARSVLLDIALPQGRA